MCGFSTGHLFVVEPHVASRRFGRRSGPATARIVPGSAPEHFAPVTACGCVALRPSVAMAVTGKSDKTKPTVYDPCERQRGWRIVHQHLSLDVCLKARKIRGTAVLSIRALNENCKVIHVNLRRCRVVECVVNGHVSEFLHASALDDQLLLEAASDETQAHRFEDIKRELDVQRNFGEEVAELAVFLPSNVVTNVMDELRVAQREVVAGAGGFADIPESPSAELHKLPNLTVAITYELTNPVDGATFYGSSKVEDALSNPLYMLTESRFGLVRTWMPCIDSMRWCDRSFFDLDVTVDKELVVVASGDLMATKLVQSNDGDERERLMFRYRSTVPAHAREIVVAAGPFMPFADPLLPKTVTHFCLPGHADELVHTGPPIFEKALAFCRDYFGFDPPCTSFKQLFVGPLGQDKSTSYCAGGGLAVLSGNLLHTSRNIDAGFLSRELIMTTIVQSYVGCLLRPRGPNDAWIIAGLCAHVSAIGLRSLFGLNWYRFRIYDEMQILCQESPSEAVVLSKVDHGVHIDVTSRKVERKAHIVVYMIERRIGSDMMRRALRDMVAEGRNVIVALSTQLDRVQKTVQNATTLRQTQHSFIIKAFSSTANSLELSKRATVIDAEDEDVEASPAASKRLRSNGVSNGFDDGLLGVDVHQFMKRLRAICGTDVKSMVRLWASSGGVPRLRSSYRYNARRHSMEFVVLQDAVEQGTLQNGKLGLPFAGTVNVRIMEVEGAFEHPVEIRDNQLSTDIQCHSRRTKKSQNDTAVRDDSYNRSPIVFVRVDTELEWCMDMNLKLPDPALIAMLQTERDAIAQYAACRGLRNCDNPAAAKALAAVLEDDQVFWRVHSEAVHTLVTCKGGLEALLNFCRSRYTDRGEDGREHVRLNNFGSYPEYFVKREIMKAIVKAKELKIGVKRKILPQAVDFTIEMLMGNDNAGNQFDDNYYVADLINAAGYIAIDSVDEHVENIGKGDDKSYSSRAIQQINRYRALDRLIPSKTGAVTCAVMKCATDYEVALMVAKQRLRYGVPVQDLGRGQLHGNEILTRLLYDNCTPDALLNVRIQAFQSLALIYSSNLSVCLWLLKVVDKYHSGAEMINFASTQNATIETAESPIVRRAIIDGLIEAVESKLWGRITPPLVCALRRTTNLAKDICIRIRRIMVGDIDNRIRDAAYRFALIVWGVGAPVCMLGRIEYSEMLKAASRYGHRCDRDRLQRPVVPEEHRKRFGVPFRPKPKPLKVSKSHKPPKSKKPSKHSSNTAAIVVSPHESHTVVPDAVHVTPPSIPVSRPVVICESKNVIKIPSSKPSPEAPTSQKRQGQTFKLPLSKPPPSSNKLLGRITIPQSKPATKFGVSSSSPKSGSFNMPKISLRSQPLSPKESVKSNSSKESSKIYSPRHKSKEAPTNEMCSKKKAEHSVKNREPHSELSFSVSALDHEDVRYMKKAWRERQRRTSQVDLTSAEAIVADAGNGSHSKEGETARSGNDMKVSSSRGDDDEERRRKKKKKKKKKRKHEEGEGEEKKKKKKKKKHREGREGQSSHSRDVDEEGRVKGSSSRPRSQLTSEPKDSGVMKLKIHRSSVSSHRDSMRD